MNNAKNVAALSVLEKTIYLSMQVALLKVKDQYEYPWSFTESLITKIRRSCNHDRLA